MLFRKMIIILANHMKPVNTLHGKNTELYCVKAGGRYGFKG